VPADWVRHWQTTTASAGQILPWLPIFDNDRQKIGRRIGDAKIVVQDVDELAKVIREESIDVMVIAVPAKAAQKVLNQVMSGGIKAVLNFAPASLTSRRGVKVKTVDLTTSLESCRIFYLSLKARRSRNRDAGAPEKKHG
jgi:NADH/NAD ratio-sensing transcriptional regulator Rex